MIRSLLLFLAALLAVPSPACAQDENPEGHWALKINDAAIWVFSLERNENGSWRGSWLRPNRFEGNGVIFVSFSGEELVTTEDGLARDGVVQLRFAPTRAGGSTDVLHFAMLGENMMTMEYLGTQLAPYPLVRVVRGTGLGPFEEGLIYDRDNAATISDYDPADEPEDASGDDDAGGDDAGEDAADKPDPSAAAQDPAPADGQPRGTIGDDFLDGLDVVGGLGDPEPSGRTVARIGTDEEVEDNGLNRACEDLDRQNLPDPAMLDALWGDDYQQLGDGLDIREYVMANGDIARVTVLDDRIFLNRCGTV